MDLEQRIREQIQLGQEQLVTFVKAELELIETFLHLASRSEDPNHSERAVDCARSGIATVRRLSGRIEDHAVAKRFDDLAAHFGRLAAATRSGEK